MRTALAGGDGRKQSTGSSCLIGIEFLALWYPEFWKEPKVNTVGPVLAMLQDEYSIWRSKLKGSRARKDRTPLDPQLPASTAKYSASVATEDLLVFQRTQKLRLKSQKRKRILAYIAGELSLSAACPRSPIAWSPLRAISSNLL
jgi:hypothetical protein